jgi:hypothetical protein
MRTYQTLAAVIVAIAAIAATPVLVYAQVPVSGTTSNTTNTTTTTITNATAAAEAATAAATTNSISANGLPIITNMTWYGSVLAANQTAFTDPTYLVYPLSVENIGYQQTDAVFAKLTQDTYACIQHYSELTKKEIQYQKPELEGKEFLLHTEEDIQRQDTCTDTIRLGVEAVCDSSTFTEATDFTYEHVDKCQEAARMTNGYVTNAEMLYG